jgi:hypothetical protein
MGRPTGRRRVCCGLAQPRLAGRVQKKPRTKEAQGVRMTAGLGAFYKRPGIRLG